jgi:capping protein beta
MTPTTPYEPSGSWDSIHVFETAERGRQAHYKLTSTVMLQLVTRRGSEGENSQPGKTQDNRGDRKGADGWKRDGEVSLSGSMTRQVSRMSLFQAFMYKVISNAQLSSAQAN